MNRSNFADNIIFTEHFGLAMSRPDHDRRYERNRNVLVVGGSGSGKTRGYFEPNVMQMNANYLITDPKGESLLRLGHMLEEHGYEVLSFNTVDFPKSLHYTRSPTCATRQTSWSLSRASSRTRRATKSIVATRSGRTPSACSTSPSSATL